MELHSLSPAKGSVKRGKRIGRGQSSGKGGTSTRGHKGAKSRSGYSRKRNFEGGQMPLQMRIPKRGFNSPNRVAYTPINLARLQEISEKFKSDNIDLKFLIDAGIVRKNEKVKILGNGELNSKLTVVAHACSKAAQSAIEEKGGTVTIV
ncbi:MAG: 50S ribosomal protein L15 [Saprospiraceae bacterium]|nr:50S ribosomal protein L15 [Saprospiraceae bacterium]